MLPAILVTRFVARLRPSHVGIHKTVVVLDSRQVDCEVAVKTEYRIRRPVMFKRLPLREIAKIT